MADEKQLGSQHFMDQLRESIDPDPIGEVTRYAQPAVRQVRELSRRPPPLPEVKPPEPALPVSQLQTVPQGTKTRNQMIAELIVALPYREAIAMGAGIAKKIGVEMSKESGLSPEFLTRAIQDWAWEWETFTDEERPVEKENPAG